MTKRQNREHDPSSPIKTKPKKRGEQIFISSSHFLELFREIGHFSLEIRAIRPSAVFGTRRRTALRREGFAWVPDLGSLLKLQEVGVSPYLVLFPLLSTL